MSHRKYKSQSLEKGKYGLQDKLEVELEEEIIRCK
jgi:hypothetical protein